MYVYILYACVIVYAYMHTHVDACGGQKTALDPLELESQVLMSCPFWVMGTKLGSSGKHQVLFNCWAFSSATSTHFIDQKTEVVRGKRLAGLQTPSLPLPRDLLGERQTEI